MKWTSTDPNASLVPTERPKKTTKTLKTNRIILPTSEYRLLCGIYHIIGMRVNLETRDFIPGWKLVEPIASAVLNLVNYINGAIVRKCDVIMWSNTVHEKLLKPLEKLRHRALRATAEMRSWDSWSDAQGFDVLVCYVLDLYLCAATMQDAEDCDTEYGPATPREEDPPFGWSYNTTPFILLDKTLLRAISVSPITTVESEIFEEHFAFCQADFEAVERSSHKKRNIEVYLTEE
jgi:hypothetical protein